MSIKPGITGMWQASGRSDITDFEEVVKLDTEYIENWSIGLDVKILLKPKVCEMFALCRYFIAWWKASGLAWNCMVIICLFFIFQN